MQKQLERQAEVSGLVESANEAAVKASETGNWDTAVTAFRTVVRELGDEAPDGLRQSLAVALANRGNAKANQAVEAYSAARRNAPEPDLFAALGRVKEEYARQNERHLSKRAVATGSIVGGILLFATWWVFFRKGGIYSWSWSWPWPGVWGRAAYAIVSVLLVACVAAGYVYVIVRPVLYFIIILFVWARSSIKSLTSPLQAQRESCVVCEEDASYGVTMDHGYSSASVPLCASHVHDLEREAESSSLDAAARLWVAAQLADATTDLREAAATAPQLDGVKASLKQLEILSSQMS
jgi:hypothetical protein